MRRPTNIGRKPGGPRRWLFGFLGKRCNGAPPAMASLAAAASSRWAALGGVCHDLVYRQGLDPQCAAIYFTKINYLFGLLDFPERFSLEECLANLEDYDLIARLRA